MNEHDKKIRTQWLIICGLCWLVSIMNLLFATPFLQQIDTLVSNTQQILITSCSLLFSIGFYFILYHCIYKKPGTKLLSVLLVLTVVNLICSPVLFYKGPTGHVPLFMWISEISGIAWLIASWRIRKTNKRLQALQQR